MKRKSESGQAIVTAAVTLTVLLLASGLAIDMGYLRYQKRHMQTAADSAALAAAAELSSDYLTAAQTDAATNGYSAAAPSQSCPPDTPSSSTPITMCAQQIGAGSAGASGQQCPSSDDACVGVMISQNVPTFFMKVAGVNSEIVTTSAVARQAVAGCIYSLGPDDYPPLGTWSVMVEGNVNANYCAVLSSGSIGIQDQSPAFSITASALGSVTGGCMGIMTCATGQVVPSTIPKTPAPPDLLSYLQADTGNLINQQYPAPTTCGNDPLTGLAYIACAGKYPSGLTLSGSGPIEPGIYAVGGTLTASGTGMITGNGVLFYTYGNSTVTINLNATYASCDNANIGAGLRLASAYSGPYAGVLFFQDPGDNNPLSITINNGDTCNNYGNTTNESYLWGAIYSPGADMFIRGIGLDSTNGCSYLPKVTLLVGQNVILSGDINIGDVDCPYVPLDQTAVVQPYNNPSNPLPPSPMQKGAVIVQ